MTDIRAVSAWVATAWLAGSVWASTVDAAVPVIDPVLAGRYFAQADSLCRADGGRLWGHSLCGPLLFVDRGTRAAVASRADTAGILEASNGAFVGTLPSDVIPANTATEWNGVRWTMVLWPPPANDTARGVLLLHELWHRVQGELGFPMTGPANAHLDGAVGRAWLRLEWRALASALTSDGAARRAAIEDALIFRAFRRDQITGAAEEERALEMHEGLAEYTGVVLATGTAADARDWAAGRLRRADAEKSFVRSFAYSSGPAYGLLLDVSRTGWRSGLTPANDLGDLLALAVGFVPPQAIAKEATRRAAHYGGPAVLAEEDRRASELAKQIAAYRARLVDGPVLRMRLRNPKVGFDPNAVVPIGPDGTVYPTLTVTEEWGVLTVEKGALLATDWTHVRVPAPSDSARTGRVTGDGWTLDLKEGWRLVPGDRPGDFAVDRGMAPSPEVGVPPERDRSR